MSYSRETQDCLVVALASGYQAGRLKRPEVTRAAVGVVYRSLLMSTINLRMNPVQAWRVSQGLGHVASGLDEAREGNFRAARERFESAMGFVSEDGSPDARLLLQALRQSAEAYLEYRTGDYEEAQARISAALRACSTLEVEFGYAILHGQRLQLIQNSVRTSGRALDFVGAARLAGDALSYMGGEKEDLPLPGVWGSDRLAPLPTEVIQGHAVAVASELAFLSARITEAEEKEQLRAARIVASGDPVLERIRLWWALETAWDARQTELLLTLGPPFLADGPSVMPQLWYGFALGVMTFCEGLATEASASLARSIREDARTWSYLRPELRAILDPVSV